MTRFSDYYRVESTRLQNWHYAAPGKYFITVCSKNMEHYFGNILNGEMQLSNLGEEVINQWLLTLSLRPDMNISLDVFQVMPNHFHGIIEIGWNKFNEWTLSPISTPDQELQSGPYGYDNAPCRDGMHAVSTRGIVVSTGNHSNQHINHLNKFGPQRKNLGSIMRGFKSSVTTYARKNKILFDWQPRYFDVLIRDDKALEKIRWYILNNMKNWERDKFNKK